jgi:hypothetical protein
MFSPAREQLLQGRLHCQCSPSSIGRRLSARGSIAQERIATAGDKEAGNLGGLRQTDFRSERKFAPRSEKYGAAVLGSRPARRSQRRTQRSVALSESAEAIAALRGRVGPQEPSGAAGSNGTFDPSRLATGSGACAQEIECSPQRRIALGVSQHLTEGRTFLVAEDFRGARFALDQCASNRLGDVGQALLSKLPVEFLDFLRDT